MLTPEVGFGYREKIGLVETLRAVEGR